MRGFDRFEALSGASVVRLHYSADSRKDSAWVAKTRRGMPNREWLREMEMDVSQFDGEPVFPEYSEAIHFPPGLKERGLPLVSGSSYFGGWDCGTGGLDLAFVLIQVTPAPHQVHVLWEMVSDGPESMQTFAPRLAEGLRRRFGSIGVIRHYGDPTGANRQGATGSSGFDEARRFGFVIRPASNAWHSRQGAVVWALADWIEEDTPRMLISGMDCPTLVDGLRGAYQWRRSASGAANGPGRVLLQPLKNSYSHVNDALQYGLLAVKGFVTGTSGGVIPGRFRS